MQIIYMQNKTISYSILLLQLAHLVTKSVSAVIFVTEVEFFSWIGILQNDLI